jgi:hypothetical protein
MRVKGSFFALPGLPITFSLKKIYTSKNKYFKLTLPFFYHKLQIKKMLSTFIVTREFKSAFLLSF